MTAKGLKRNGKGKGRDHFFLRKINLKESGVRSGRKEEKAHGEGVGSRKGKRRERGRERGKRRRGKIYVLCTTEGEQVRKQGRTQRSTKERKEGGEKEKEDQRPDPTGEEGGKRRGDENKSMQGLSSLPRVFAQAKEMGRDGKKVLRKRRIGLSRQGNTVGS